MKIGSADIDQDTLQAVEDFGASLTANGRPASHVALACIIVGVLQLRRLLKPGVPVEQVDAYVIACCEAAEAQFQAVPSEGLQKVKRGSVS